MPRLHIVSPNSLARTIDLTQELMGIGRTPDNDIQIQDPNISRRHGILVRDGEEYQLHDFNSANGTFVNGQRIMAVKLQHGASIRLGPIELKYESTPAQAAAPANAESLITKSDPGLIASPGPQKSSAKVGMAKVIKPEFAGSKLQTGPVTLKPGFSAKPIPPPARETPES
jgi:pSer/pThr/pTyr-binding forkhead associated (FHA) protein